MRKKIVISTSLFSLAIIFASILFLWNSDRENRKPREIILREERLEKNYFEINDDLAGVYFRVGKNFERISNAELQAKNSMFIYGFHAKSDKDAYCVVSQTKKVSSTEVKFSDIETGIIEQLKKSATNVLVDTKKIIEVGENNNGARLNLSYDYEGSTRVQWEVVGIGENMTTFVFCNSSKAVVDLYKDDFDLFLDSIRIK